MAGLKRLPIVLDETQRARFWVFVLVPPTATPCRDCWLWSGSKNHFGHGHFKVGPRPLKAHRIAWVLANGPIPDDKEIDHVCRNPSCVNPQHMEIVSTRENTLRGEGITAKQARRTHCKNGHELSGNNIRKVGRELRRCLTCHRERGRVSQAKRRAVATSSESTHD